MKQEKTSVRQEPQVQEVNLRHGENPVQQEKSLQKRLKQKRFWVGLTLVFFLFCFIFIIPVGRVPGLRNLAWKIGVSQTDAQQISTGRVLWSWVRNGFKHFGSAEDEILLFDKIDPYAAPHAKGESALFDLKALNASRRKRGLKAENIDGIYNGPETEKPLPALNHAVKGWSKEALSFAAQAQKQQEVYFLQDASSLDVAEPNQGSSDTIALLPKAAIVGAAGPQDWVADLAYKADEAQGVELPKTGKQASKTQAVQQMLAQTQAKEDLAEAYLLSRSAEKALHPMRKQQLATAAYLAGSTAPSDYEVGGVVSGVILSGKEKVTYQDPQAKKDLSDKQCEALSKKVNAEVAHKLQQSRLIVQTIYQSVPKSCNDRWDLWKGYLGKVTAYCQDIQKIVQPISGQCGMQIYRPGTCEAYRLNSYVEQLGQVCESLAAAQAVQPAKKEKVQPLLAEQKEIVEQLTEGEVFNTFNIDTDTGRITMQGEFFPVLQAY
ncbi:hypothetical protein [Candidatus Avelusimicrobium sp.]